MIDISAGRAGWVDWLAAKGLPTLKPRRFLSFDTIPSAIEAAVQGRGVLLGLLPLILESPAARSLVVPFPTTPVSAGAYFVACRKMDRSRVIVHGFMEWLFAEMRIDSRRLKKMERDRLSVAREALD